jgi:hypothetical protein
MSQLEARLSQLSAYDRALAQAQMARAEAIVDAGAAVAAFVRRILRAIAAPVVARARSYTDVRTRRWPHAKSQPDVAEFPSIGLQH